MTPSVPPRHSHKSWALRAALLLVVTAIAVIAIAAWAQHPLVWIAAIAGMLPASMYLFVARPELRGGGTAPGR